MTYHPFPSATLADLKAAGACDDANREFVAWGIERIDIAQAASSDLSLPTLAVGVAFAVIAQPPLRTPFKLWVLDLAAAVSQHLSPAGVPEQFVEAARFYVRSETDPESFRPMPDFYVGNEPDIFFAKALMRCVGVANCKPDPLGARSAACAAITYIPGNGFLTLARNRLVARLTTSDLPDWSSARGH